jgi:hypothetical protein
VSQVRKKSLACDTFPPSVAFGVAGGRKNADLRRGGPKWSGDARSGPGMTDVPCVKKAPNAHGSGRRALAVNRLINREISS